MPSRRSAKPEPVPLKCDICDDMWDVILMRFNPEEGKFYMIKVCPHHFRWADILTEHTWKVYAKKV
jgi:hypothetical protein